jgi:hypothetical protein
VVDSNCSVARSVWSVHVWSVWSHVVVHVIFTLSVTVSVHNQVTHDSRKEDLNCQMKLGPEQFEFAQRRIKNYLDKLMDRYV